MNSIDWQAIATFEAVTRLGTFTLAANELKLLQPSVSRRIAKLEGELGVHLMLRTRPRVTLTHDGEALLQASQSTIKRMSEALAGYCQVAQRQKNGGILIACSHSAGARHLLPDFK